MYKWVDESGHTQFSDRPPPPGIKFEKIDKVIAPDDAPSAPAASSDAPSSFAQSEFEFRKRQQAAEEKRKQDEQKENGVKARQEDCDLAKSRLKILGDGGRFLKPNESGDREYMSDEEIEAEKIKAQKNAEEACK
jgi:hypothetical protein